MTVRPARPAGSASTGSASSEAASAATPIAEELVVDRYLDALLAAAETRERVPLEPPLEPELAVAAERLSDELVRVHPSFRFEERLAARLASVASGMRLGAVAGGRSEVVAFTPPSWGSADPLSAFDPSDEPIGAVPASPSAPTTEVSVRGDRGLPSGSAGRGGVGLLVIGGAVASAAVSLAGAAFVAWRLNRSADDRFARAVRAVNAARAVNATRNA